MNISSRVSKLPNMHFRAWRVAAHKFTSWQAARSFCRENGVPYNPIFVHKLNPQIPLPLFKNEVPKATNSR